MKSHGALPSPSVSVPLVRSHTGVILLVLTKTLDLATTVIGLTLIDGVREKNPVAAWAYSQYGVIGLVALSLIGVIIILAVVETASQWLASTEDCSIQRTHLTMISYIPLSVVFAFATINNTLLLLELGL